MKKNFYRILKKKIGRCSFGLLFFLFANDKINAQESEAATIPFGENLYVHTDKKFYVTGEIIWFKVYAMNYSSGLPDSISKIAYIELLTPENKPALQAKIRLNNGCGDGSLQLPTSLNSGNYMLRAYTNWMKNFDARNYFYSTIGIVNALKSSQLNIAPGAVKYDIGFFPEGGNLISGLENQVAFKISDAYGKGINARGIVLDENNDSVAAFNTLKFGIGSFPFTPAAGKHYHARVTADNNNFIAPLPDQQYGYLLHVDDADTSISISVRSNPIAANNIVHLVIQGKNGGRSSNAIYLQEGAGVLNISKNLLAEGINQFTLFNADQAPVCARLYFKNPSASFAVNASLDKQVYGKREPVTIDFPGLDSSQTNLSISVCLVDSLPAEEGSSIMSYLWLERELKDFIESPEYYFSNDKQVATATDNLMLTQSMKKINPNDSMPGRSSFLPEYEGHIITGKVTNKKNGEPAASVTAYLSVPGKSFRLAVAISDQQGMIRFNVPGFAGSDEIVVQTNQTPDSNYRIDISNPFSEKFPAMGLPPLFINESMQNLLRQRSVSSQVMNAYWKDQQNQFFGDEDDSIPFFGNADKTYFLDDYTRFTTMEEVLREYVSEIAPRKRHENFHLKVANKGSAYLDGNPLVLVDGVPFFDMDTVISFDPLKIKSLSVVGKKYYYGPLVFYGIVSYATYNGDLEGINLDPNSLVMEYDALQLQRKFYVPRYETESEKESRLPDFRTTLYWTPDLQLNPHEQKKLSFYTSDIAGNYQVVLQGLTDKGKPVSETLTFQVK